MMAILELRSSSLRRARACVLIGVLGTAVTAVAGCVRPGRDGRGATSDADVSSTDGLDAPLLFDAQYYSSLYGDLQTAFGGDQAALRAHWLDHGIQEGRRASPIFDCSSYFALY